MLKYLPLAAILLAAPATAQSVSSQVMDRHTCFSRWTTIYAKDVDPFYAGYLPRHKLRVLTISPQPGEVAENDLAIVSPTGFCGPGMVTQITATGIHKLTISCGKD